MILSSKSPPFRRMFCIKDLISMNLKINLPFFLVAFFAGNISLFAQVEDDESCVAPEDKKVMKLMTEAETSKNDRATRTMAYTDALAIAPENSYIYFSFAEYNFDFAESIQTKFDQGRADFNQLKTAYLGAAKAYQKVIEYCSDYHSDAYYKLGYIYYLLGDSPEAAKYFKAFVEFKSNDPNKYASTYAKNKADVEEILPEMAFFEKFYANPVPYDPTRVNNVSSQKDEFLPMISPDNELIFYTRRGNNEDRGIVEAVIESFTMSQRANLNAPFDSGEALRAPFNTPVYQNYGGVSLSLDNKEMFICACEEVDYQAHANCDIYRTTFERSGQGGNDFIWSKLENLGPNVNTKDGWEAQPTLSADGHTLYFATWREGSQLTDIYFSTRQADGSWSRAQPVPGPINSEGHDKAPFIHQDSETMYFVSTTSSERPGAGGTDIFYTRKDEKGNWMEPTNIGVPINSAGDEVGLVVSTDGHLAYYTSRNATSEGFDIYYFELYEEARPKKVKFYKGTVTDSKGEPVKDAVVEISYKDSEENVKVHVNGDDGKFAAIINVDEGEEQDVIISIKKEGYSFDTQLIKAEALKDDEVFMPAKQMEIDTIKVGKAFTIENILFATDSYELSSDSKFILDQFVKFLIENPTVKVSIQGHTDDVGNDASNKLLSANRSKATMDYLISRGINANRLKSEGFGETKPKVPNNSEANRAINRRTDFFITDY